MLGLPTEENPQGYPGGSTDYVLTFSGSSDVSDFSDYELKRETESQGEPVAGNPARGAATNCYGKLSATKWPF